LVEDHKSPYLSKNNLANKLNSESSPYLLQHMYNAVNWFPWGPEAIELARYQDKPILLSIGYSACHWCHVMMHESFEDIDVAATMNRLFINIKVDKEERPDLDKAYQIAHQLLMGRAGGWPLTMFLSPTSLIPYFGGTYFPKKAMAELPDFQALLHRLNEVYYHEKEKIQQQELHIQAILHVISQPRIASHLPLAQELRHDAELVLQAEFDPVNSGFGNDAKFPNCPSLDFLLESKDPLIRHMPLTTLKHMAEGGIYDQLAGGFFRYTVDPTWQIPHFEKMLYDNAQLIGAYTKAFAITNNELYKNVVLETSKWLQTTMLDPETGGFYTSIDADSEAQEGLYYLWDVNEVKTVLSNDEFERIKKYYGFDHKPNFESKWHLLINTESTAPTSADLDLIKQKLLAQREAREKPFLDRKILTGWNGLAIHNLSLAGQTLQQPALLNMAENCITFIQEKLFIDQELFATYQNGAAKINGFLDDYAYVLYGVLTFINDDPKHPLLEFCKNLADSLISKFYDQENGGFFFIPSLSEKLFYNPKTYTDDATPSSNAIACIALIRLSKLLNDQSYLNIAKKSISAGQSFLNDAPEVHLTLLEAYAMLHANP
jgi:uncharacterized protein YyaL (SSP411 family)